ncbi:caspase-7-like [Crassostrea angulata]|uniref:caspase-7-like n=1 Tax=Magallana angulata TaxID=2784310 RepID=UPI0022B19ECB|nr:caspase-7-like [Crassostrea angulata]
MPGPRYDAQKCMGKVLIVNNQTYYAEKEKDKNRPIDIGKEDKKVEELIKTLNDLGFTVLDVEKNKTRDQMIKLLKEVAAKSDLKDDYCFICIVLSYGQDGVITCYDETHSPKNPTAGMQLPVSELQECLKGDKCKGLLLKPKIFMLQLEEALRDSKDGIETGAQAPKPVKIPREADFLTYTCERERAITTWEKGLKQYVQEPKQPLEIQKLLTRMNRLYCEYYSTQGMTVDTPCVTSLLTREAYLKIEEPSPK